MDTEKKERWNFKESKKRKKTFNEKEKDRPTNEDNNVTNNRC